jgi:phage regulator Rha-like protein
LKETIALERRMAVKVVVKADSRYLQERSGAFRPIENLSITASTPAYPAVLHSTRRTMILADDHTHAVIPLDKEMLVSRNDEMSVILIAYAEPTAATWKALELHMESEKSTAEAAREAKGKALLERKKVKAAEVQ